MLATIRNPLVVERPAANEPADSSLTQAASRSIMLQSSYREAESSFTGPRLRVDVADLPDLTGTLLRDKEIIGHGSFGVVYSCSCTQNGKVAVKVVVIPSGVTQDEKEELIRKMKRELGIWRRLDHDNIVPLLGTARGEDFASQYTCMVSSWMPNGTLFEYVLRNGMALSVPSRIQLIKGIVSGLHYLHSQPIVHGDFHPGNIMIDAKNNARFTDFGLSQVLRPASDRSTYLWTSNIRPGAFLWTAPELLYPDLYPDFRLEATLGSDIYSLGTTILFILSGRIPWNRAEAESRSKEFQNPPRPLWPVNIPNTVWSFIEKCWSPRRPQDRPSAQEALLFSTRKLGQSLYWKPKPVLKSNINVVLFGTHGCGKSSIINLLTEEPVAQVSSDGSPCTKRPRWYPMSIGGTKSRLWDTMGFHLAQGEDPSLLFPYEQAHCLLQNLREGVDIILLCARKDGIFPALGDLYRLINEFFYAGHAPIAFVVTNFDTPDEGWWERNRNPIAQRTGIPVQSIPHVCITTVGTGRVLSEQKLRTFLEDYVTITPPASLRPELSSCTTTSLHSLASNSACGLGHPEAAPLLRQLAKPPFRPYNVVLFGEAGVGKSSIINLIVGHPIATVSSGIKICTLAPRSYEINTGLQRFLVWDTMGFNEVRLTCGDATKSAAQLIRDLSRQDGVDLLVFCKRGGRLTRCELGAYRLFKEFLCDPHVPTAIVVTHLESLNPMDEWWQENGDEFIKALGARKDAIRHACITSLVFEDACDVKHRMKLSESRLSVQTILEDCVPHSTPKAEEFLTKLNMWRAGGGGPRRKMTVKNLVDRLGFSMPVIEAEELVRLWHSTE